ncbi:MAG: sugar phosphate isomerase/epimerase family protein [Planctomycetota bacterium]|jgi:sugar phosphate isomerase/epimerase
MMKTNKPISRRQMMKTSLAAAAMLASAPAVKAVTKVKKSSVRLGGPVFEKYEDPAGWVAAVKKLGYSAAYCPVGANAGNDVVKAYEKAAKEANIIIAEVGAWSNPISPNEKMRKEAQEKCRRQLDLADRIGAKCCVNISGSRSDRWEGPSPENLTEETFDMIVETTREIIDDVKPTRTHFTLEMMPWSYPDSVDSYVRLIKAIDRERFAVHLDPVNIVCSPQRYFNNGRLIKECFKKLGPQIKSCHGKDILLDTKLTTHLDEVRPGLGGLDYVTFLKELSYRPDVPLMLEHLPNAEEYRLAAEHVRSVGKKAEVSFV